MNLRRVLVILVAGILVVGLAACTKKPPKPEETAPPTPADASKEPSSAEEDFKTTQMPTQAEIEGVEIQKLQAQVEDIYFDFDRYSLRPDAVQVMARNAKVLLENRGARVEIEGHCDERGTNEYNLALGERRAKAARDYLVRAGVEASRLSTLSYGEEKPLDPGHDEAAWAKNRRAHFRVTAVR